MLGKDTELSKRKVHLLPCLTLLKRRNMSRTFRRKGYEVANMHWKNGTKVAGFYTVRDGTYNSHSLSDKGLNFRKPTRQEHNKEYWNIHGDRYSGNSWSPSHFHRLFRMKENRMLTKLELARYKKDNEYEVLVEANPRSCLWDWI